MPARLKKYTLRFSATAILCISLLAGIVLNPSMLYAGKNIVGHYTVFHAKPISKEVLPVLDQVTKLVQRSELYDAKQKIDLCLNDGSSYPALVEKLTGPAFARGFYDKIVVFCEADFKSNLAELNGYRWNLTQLLAHEETHCQQFHHFGFFHSNPLAAYPAWKWEGYPEYIARRNKDQLDLAANISRKCKADRTDPSGWAIAFQDGTIAPRDYYEAWLLVQYCLDVQHMNYQTLLKDTASRETIQARMMNWYAARKRP